MFCFYFIVEAQYKMLYPGTSPRRGLGGLKVSALEPRGDIMASNTPQVERNFQTISTPSSYTMCPGLSIEWTGLRLVTEVAPSAHV